LSLESGLSCSNGSIHIGLTGSLDIIGDERAIRWVIDGEWLLGFGVDVLRNQVSFKLGRCM